ncbi:uncharacterized protein LOC113870105 [Abrus precatorius]|uniref:Uncharacterized protein LOC113870105 n=1 Tax=Abrus precatorius TaxID=3816 RepID=A0A8B8M1H2_ABRPR|nr:uncharacterized protein LOC113870105 [Abrus precatorius]
MITQYASLVETPFWNSSPHYTYINWEHADDEMENIDVDPDQAWREGDALVVGQKFESKEDVKMAIKSFALKTHQSYIVVKSNPTKFHVKCPNHSRGCPWRVKATLGKNFEMENIDVDPDQAWREGDALVVGQKFESKEDVKMAIKSFALKTHQSYIVVKSNPTKFHVKCPNHSRGCPWRVKATLGKNFDKWKITRCGRPHTCFHAMMSLDYKKLDSNFICSCVLVSYKKAWKAKQKVIVKVFGDWDESYATLPRWLEYMQLNSSGSVYKIETNDYVRDHQVDNRYRVFHRLFWSFQQCITAFNFCKPLIQVDGTFLYGKYRQTLLIATAQDGNNCVLPIAFAIVEGETLSAWEWFLALIRLHVTEKAGYTTCKQRFEEKLEQFCNESEDIRKWINCISKEKWTLAYDEKGRHYGHMTTNLSEAVNKILKGAQNLSITALVKCTYARLVEYFVKRGEKATTELNAEEAFNPITQRGGNKWTVILSNRFCVDPVYSVQSVVNAYSSEWWPLGNDNNILRSNEWKLVPDDQRSRKIGRPKSTLIRNEMDWIDSQPHQQCGRCKQSGHDQRHCARHNEPT